jgi:hypothetical protein
MSRHPGDRPADGPTRPLRSIVGRPPRQSLLRHDIADDPDQGVALYEALASQDTSGLSADGWADRLEAIGRVNARLAAWEAEAIAGFDDVLHGVSADLGHRHPEPGDRPATPGERRWVAGDLRSVSDEIALILNMHKPHATARIHTACELVHNFAATLHALREGWLTERAAFTIVRELSVLDDLDDLRAAEAAVLAWARTHPLTEIKQECQREAARRSPAASNKRHQRAHDERSVRMIPDGDGRAVLILDQDAIDAAAVTTSLSRAAARARRNGDPRTTNQLRADIALNRLLRHKRTAPAHVADEPATPGNHPAPTELRDNTADQPPRANDHVDTASYRDPDDLEAPASTEPPYDPSDEPLYDRAYEPLDDSAYEPCDDRAFEPLDERRFEPGEAYWAVEHSNDNRGDNFGDAAEVRDPDLVDEASIGAEAMVVIHATAAEVDALINGQAATGGEADHHGPIPQSSLRKHLIKALTQGLLPNLPTTPTSPHPGAATRRPRTDLGIATAHDTRSTNAPGTTATQDTRSTNARADTGAAVTRGTGVRIELRITDRPPPSDPDRYTPSPALDRYVRWRDRTCQFPGCNRPAEYADLDHRIPFAAGGRTTAANLWCLCRHHHRLKHEGGWQIHPNTDGSWTWTSPTGRHYRNNPTTYHPPPDPPGSTAPAPPWAGVSLRRACWCWGQPVIWVASFSASSLVNVPEIWTWPSVMADWTVGAVTTEPLTTIAIWLSGGVFCASSVVRSANSFLPSSSKVISRYHRPSCDSAFAERTWLPFTSTLPSV